MFRFFIYASCLIGCQNQLFSQQGIIPQPVEVTWSTNSAVFHIAPTAYIQANDFEAFKDAVAFRDLSIRFLDLPLKTATKKMGNGPAITVQYDSASTLPPGGYELIITSQAITITGSPGGGVFHGLMSLLQLIQGEKSTGYSIPCGTIVDYPRFNWRGMHLDVSRHFFSVDEVKEYIDYLALYKFNTFHWHLTDDQGWRIEIKQYPKLTDIGAWRNGSTVGHYSDHTYDSIRYGGFYTQEEIAEVVDYATKRRITIVPEIEMPGHALAALAAYPEYACNAGPFEVGKQYGVYEDVFCSKDSTFVFLENILNEVMALFPSKVIHIGGDEVLKNRWKACTNCQGRMQEENLHSEEELQSYFIQRIERLVNSQGRTIIGWDEILEGGLAPNAMVMSWRGTSGGIAAARSGHQVVMSPNNECYFDHYQGDPKTEPLAIGGMTTLRDVYAYEPIPKELNEKEAKFIIGAQANIWTEYILNFDQVEYMALPRMIALSEVVWSPVSERDYVDFKERLTTNVILLDRVRVNYSRSWMIQE